MSEGKIGKCNAGNLTFFGVAWSILAGVAHLPIEVPGPVLQDIVPVRDHKNSSQYCSFYYKAASGSNALSLYAS